MAYLALYRKYRPTTFENLIGQEHIVKTLVNQITTDKLGHAYLFTGTRGTGKTSAAKIFAKAINCLSPINGSPCGKCEVCKALSDPSNIDIMEIDAASNNGVNEIRDLREKVQYPPVSCKYKVYIVDEVHMLTGAAFNALLKTLEEPPKHAVFILATTEVHKIPATILSRCMRFDFRLISNQLIANVISKIYDEQGKKYQKEAIMAIAKAGEGSMRDALSIADIALSYNNDVLTYEDVMDVLGSTNSDLVLSFIKDLLDGNSGNVLSTVNELCSLGKSIGVLTKDITAVLRDLLVVKTCKNANQILALPDDKYSEFKNIADTVSEDRLIRALEIFSQAENSLKYTTHPRVVFETASVKIAKPESDYNIDALLARIKDLEIKVQNGIKVKVEHAQTKSEVVKIEQDDTKIEPKSAEPNNQQTSRLTIQSIGIEDLKGKLLLNLRKIGSEMLWNVVQGVKLEVIGNVLIITCSSSNDQDLLDRGPSRSRIEEALEEFMPFELQIKLSEHEQSLDEVDQATERIKKIFGDDIVVIK